MPETDEDRNMQAEIVSAANRVVAIIEAGFVTHGSGRYVSFRSEQAGSPVSGSEAERPKTRKLQDLGI